MNDNVEQVVLEIEDSKAVAGAKRINAALSDIEKKAGTTAGSMGRAFEGASELIVRTSDRSRNSVERLVASAERLAQISGKTGVERLVQQRDALIQRLGGEEAAVARVTAAYSKLLSAQEGAANGGNAGGARGGSGFNTRFAFSGIKDLLEGRQANAIAEMSNELISLQGSAAIIGGVVTGVAGIGFAAYEAVKGLRELEEQPAKLAAQFSRFLDSNKASNDELLVTNDRLENTIAKMEHRPQNNLKLMLDESAVAADKLADRLDKSLQAFTKLVEESKPGWAAQIVGFLHGGIQGADDIKELIGGKSGFGGMIANVYGITTKGGDPTAALSNYRGQVQNLLDVAENAKNFQAGRKYRTDLGPIETTANQDSRIEILRALQGEIDSQVKTYALEKQNSAASKRAADLQERQAGASRVAELEKQATIQYAGAFFRGSGPRGEYFARLEEIKASENKDLRDNPLDRRNITAQYDIERRTAFLKFDDESKKALTDLRDVLLTGDEIAKAALKPYEAGGANFKKLETGLREGGLIDQDGRLTSRVFGSGRLPPPADYVSPQEQLRNAQSGERYALGLYGASARVAGLNEGQTIEGMYSIREKYADLEKAALLRLADLQETEGKQEIARADALERRKQRSFDDEMEREQSLAEMRAKQFEKVKSEAASLFETLFTNPSKFGGQLLGKVRGAFLKPITDGLGGMAASFLQPVIFGRDGGGGIAGALGGLFSRGSGGIQDIQLIGGALPVVIVGAGRGSGGGFSSASAAARMVGGEILGGGDSTAGLVQTASGLWRRGPDGDLGSIAGVGGTGGFAGGYGGGGGRGNPLSGLLGNLRGGFRGINWGGLTRSGPTAGIDAGGVPTLTGGGRITGVNGLAGAALTAGGMALAQQGLLGSSRGTWGGVAEGALGGAAVGFALGGPLGAAIGGGVGLLIGLGEKIAGVETPEREASRLILQIYGIKMDAGSTTIKQVVAMAQQNFGGTISIAVRSPQVRELIQLYADNTGQRSSLLNSLQIHSASLAQSGGGLYQQATYSNGTPYTYSSPLPTLGPSGSTISTSSPMSGGAVSVHLDPQQTVDLWQTGTAQAIAGNPRGVAMAAGNGNQQSASRLNAAGLSLNPEAIWS